MLHNRSHLEAWSMTVGFRNVDMYACASCIMWSVGYVRIEKKVWVKPYLAAGQQGSGYRNQWEGDDWAEGTVDSDRACMHAHHMRVYTKSLLDTAKEEHASL